ncbi:MAG: hypothetical protein BWX70_02209 [Verrucomicrobia bacterium ADurb.Bin070]|nr:MAG: hypothetical protein BWX70_02209 [Verrucomicrobia bacterium ADurb.Bin070]
MVAQQQQEGLLPHPALGQQHGVAEAAGPLLRDEGQPPADRAQPARLLRQGGRQLAQRLGTGVGLKIGAEARLVLGLDDQRDLFDAGRERLFDDHLDDRLGDAVGRDHRQEGLGHRLGVREHARAESGHGDHRFAHRDRACDIQLETGHAVRALEIGGERVARGGRAADELHAAVALRADAFAAVGPFVDARIGQHAVQARAAQLLADRHEVLVEDRLRLAHERAERGGVAGLDRRAGGGHNALVLGAQAALHRLVARGVGKGIGVVEIGQDADGVLLAAEVGDQQMEVAAGAQRLHAEAVGVEGHHHGDLAVGAPLIHAAAARGRGDLALIGGLDLGARGEAERVDLIEGARHQHAEGGRGAEPFLDRQRGLVVVDLQSVHAVEVEHVGGHAGGIAEEAAGRGLGLQARQLHRHAPGVGDRAVGQGRAHHQFAGAAAAARVEPLVGAGDDDRAGRQIRVGAAVAAGPV